MTFEYKPSEATKLALFKLDLKLIALVIKTDAQLRSASLSRFPLGGVMHAEVGLKNNLPEWVEAIKKNKPGLNQ